jgi:hypothetical protein
MSDLDRWAREHRHRIKREQISKIRASRSPGLMSGAFSSGQIGWSHLASGVIHQAGMMLSSGAISGGAIASGGISSKGTPMPDPIDWSKVYGAIGAG